MVEVLHIPPASLQPWPFISAPLTQHFTFPLPLCCHGRTDEEHVWTSTKQPQATRQLNQTRLLQHSPATVSILLAERLDSAKAFDLIDRWTIDTIDVNTSDRTIAIEHSIASHFQDDLIHDTSTALRQCVSAAFARLRPMLPRWTKTRFLARQGRRAVFDDRVPANQQARDAAPPLQIRAYPSCHLATEHRIPRLRL